MIPGPGLLELLIIMFIGIWQIGFPLAVLFLLFRIWQRLQRIEERLEEIGTQMSRQE